MYISKTYIQVNSCLIIINICRMDISSCWKSIVVPYFSEYAVNIQMMLFITKFLTSSHFEHNPNKCYNNHCKGETNTIGDFSHTHRSTLMFIHEVRVFLFYLIVIVWRSDMVFLKVSIRHILI